MDKELTVQKENEAAPKVEFDQDGKPIRHFVSAGEKIHDRLTYQGVDWLMNSSFGVWFSWFTERTNFGQKHIMARLDRAWTHILSPVFLKTPAEKEAIRSALKSGSNLMEGNEAALSHMSNSMHGSVKWGTRLVNIMFGGTITVIPLMILENHKNKKAMSKFFDRMIYGKDAVENDPKFQQAYAEIDQEPKKGFGTGMLTRVISLAPIFGMVLTPPIHNTMKKNYYDHVEGLSTWGAKKLNIKPPASMSEPRRTYGDSHDAPVSDWKYIHETIGFDFGVTVIYSILHEITYKFVSKFTDSGYRHAHAKHKKPAEHPLAFTINDDDGVATEQPPERDKHGKTIPPKETQPGMQVHAISRDQHKAQVAEVSQLGAS